MIRLLSFLILAVAVAAAVGWFATEPGSVLLTFRGWEVETSPGFAALGMVLVVIATVVVFASLSWLFGAPRRIRAWRETRRRDRGLKALAAGMVAVAAGDPEGAAKQAKRAGRLLDAAPLTLLLSAQSAQLQGDERAAENYFKEMLARPDTEFLGLRGLLLQAGRAGDTAGALAYVKRAAELRPDSSWVQRSLFELSVKSGLWGEAEAALRRAVRRGAVARELGARHRAAILLQQSADAEAKGFGVEARNLAGKARRTARDFVPAVLRAASLERQGGKERSARRLLESAWRSQPHPEIARAYGDLCADGAKAAGEAGEAVQLARVKGLEKLVASHPDDPQGHLALAEAALDARLWGEARAHLKLAQAQFDGAGAPEAPPARLYRLFARCEEEEHGDAAAASRYLFLAGDAAADDRWVCAECGHGFAVWSAACAHCQAFDSLTWKRPEPVAVIAAGPDGTLPAALIGAGGGKEPAPGVPAKG